MGVVLGDSSRRELMAKPTENLAAYDEFLKGEAAARGMKNDQASLRQAISFLRECGGARLHLRAGVEPAVSGQKLALLERRSRYRSWASRRGSRRSAPASSNRRIPRSISRSATITAASIRSITNSRPRPTKHGLRLAPDNVDLLGAAALTEVSLGRWDGAASRLARATLLDPRSANTFRRLATVHAFLRNYPAADSAADRAIALAPTNPTIVLVKVLIALARGDLDSARAVVKRTETQIDPGTLLPFMALYQDLYWVLDDEEQRQVLAAPPIAFDNDRASWGIVRAEIYHLRGDRAHAAIYADSARLAFLEQTRSEPEDGQRRVLLGLSLAYLGRKADAVREGLAGVKLIPISQNGLTGPYVQLQMVRIYLLVGEPEKALDQLEPLAQSAVLPLAGMAPDRSDVRAGAEEPQVPENGGRKNVTHGESGSLPGGPPFQISARFTSSWHLNNASTINLRL